MGKRRFPITGGSAHEGVEQGKDRDDLIEAGKKLKRAKMREAQEATDGAGGESGVGVKSMKKAWANRYPSKRGQKP